MEQEDIMLNKLVRHRKTNSIFAFICEAKK
jgi:hypothetical protein